jgi:hypothetical protein
VKVAVEPATAPDFDRVSKLCLSLPDVEEKLSHGEPSFFVRKRLFVTFATNHEVDDASEVRIEKIARIIAACRFGIHEICRTEPDPETNLPRFN